MTKMTFSTLGLNEQLLRAVRTSGYANPTPIQQQAIPAIINGNDVLAAAQTGTGKTAGFTLPLLQHLAALPPATKKCPRALILTPTRELAGQVVDSVRVYGKYLPVRSVAVFGGVAIGRQISKLSRGVDVVVATPGRLLDLFQQKAIQFAQIEMLVLDEADRMLDMGFIRDIKKILALIPAERQNMMFSATFSPEIRSLAGRMMNAPIEIDVAPRNSAVTTVSQTIHPVDKGRKAELLAHLVNSENWYQVLVFRRTKHSADALVRKLARHEISAAAIHGNKSQAQRTRVLEQFKRNKVQILVATDIASRGLDIDRLAHVVNFDLPDIPEDYVHRIGRTGRAGATGQAISLVCADEIKQLRDIERLTNKTIDRVVVDGFEPQEALPNPGQGKKKAPKKKGKPGTPKKPKTARGSNKTASGKNHKKRRRVKKDTAQSPSHFGRPKKLAA